MTPISQDFAPPFKLIAPYFIIGSLFYLVSAFFIFFFNVDDLHYLDYKVLSLVHLFLLGFIMMIIFGAMAQLVPVVLEVGHFGVELFYAIWPLLLVGTLLMVLGFLFSPTLLPYGGMIVLISMMIFVMEIFMTISKVEKLSLVMNSILISNIFLFFGVIFGFIMAIGYAGTIDVDINALLSSHVFLLIGGYICITIMGLSIVLIPMFTLSHGFSMVPLKISMSLMSLGVMLVVIAAFFRIQTLEYTGYFLSIVSMLFYFYLVFIIYKTRPRKINDVYALSLLFSYISMLMSLTLSVVYFMDLGSQYLLAAGWLLIFGFFGFLITGHIYKIIPFLVWFEKFSPLVGKEKVPMLADMVPYKSSQAQFVFSAVGVVIITIAIITQNNTLVGAGASFLVVGAFALVRSVLYMINFK